VIPFVTNPQFLARYDGRWVGKNVLDNATAATIAQLADPTSAGGAILELLLTEASEMLMAAAAVAARYTEDEVRTYGGTLLARIVCDLCIGLVMKRRGRAVTDQEALSASYNEALGYIEQLRRGERIFWQVPEQAKAGLPESAPMQTVFDPPLISQQAERYFGCPAGGGPSGGGNPYYPNYSTNPNG
jgi:hypothetical protein